MYKEYMIQKKKAEYKILSIGFKILNNNTDMHQVQPGYLEISCFCTIRNSPYVTTEKHNNTIT